MWRRDGAFNKRENAKFSLEVGPKLDLSCACIKNYNKRTTNIQTTYNSLSTPSTQSKVIFCLNSKYEDNFGCMSISVVIFCLNSKSGNNVLVMLRIQNLGINMRLFYEKC